jgi:hypothetical protein
MGYPQNYLKEIPQGDTSRRGNAASGDEDR